MVALSALDMDNSLIFMEHTIYGAGNESMVIILED